METNLQKLIFFVFTSQVNFAQAIPHSPSAFKNGLTLGDDPQSNLNKYKTMGHLDHKPFFQCRKMNECSTAFHMIDQLFKFRFSFLSFSGKFQKTVTGKDLIQLPASGFVSPLMHTIRDIAISRFQQLSKDDTGRWQLNSSG